MNERKPIKLKKGILEEYCIKNDPSGSGRKWIERHDGRDVEDITLQEIERSMKLREEESKKKLLYSEAFGM